MTHNEKRDEEPLPMALKRIRELEAELGAERRKRDQASPDAEIMTQQICPICHQTGHDDREHRDEMIVRLHNDNREINETHLTRIRELEAELERRTAWSNEQINGLEQARAALREALDGARRENNSLAVENAGFVQEAQVREREIDMLTGENDGLVRDIAALRAYQRKTDEAIRNVALFIEADDKPGLKHWLRRGIVRIVRGEPRLLPCPECKITGGHKMSCNQAPEPIRRMHAKAKAGTLEITYGGRDEELAYLREAIEKEPDPAVRVRMQRRLDYVESKTEPELMADFLEPDEPEEPVQ